MLKTHVIAVLLVYFLAFCDHTNDHDHVHAESIEDILEKRAR